MNTKLPQYIQHQKVTLVREATNVESKKVLSSSDTNELLRQLIQDMDYDISYQENFFLLGLNKGNKMKFFCQISKGGTALCLIDPKVIFTHLLVSGCTAFMVSHNHPSGSLKYSPTR